MSLLPFLLEAEMRPRRLLEQQLGLALAPEELLAALVPGAGAGAHSRGDYYRPLRQLAAAARDLGSSIRSDADKVQWNLDVQHFAPEEISVKTVDGHVVVEGRHEERQDEHGFVSRRFVRKYALPEGCDPDTVQSRLSSDGVLSVEAPRRPLPSNERAVPVQHTGPVRKQLKDSSAHDSPPAAAAN